MAYFVCLSLFSTFLWFFVSLTVAYAIQVCWVWLKMGCIGFLAHFIFYEIMISGIITAMTSSPINFIHTGGLWFYGRRVRSIAWEEA